MQHQPVVPQQASGEWTTQHVQPQKTSPFKIALKVDDTSYSFKMLDL